MPYLGTKGLKASDIRRFNVTGSTSATHTLTWVAPTEQSLIVTINGVKQQEDAYSVSGTTLTLTSALVATDKMEVVGINDVGTTVTPAQNSVNLDKLATTGTPSSSTFLRGDMAWTAVSDVSGLSSVQIFTSSGTWTKTEGITKVMVEVQGAGGSGSAHASNDTLTGGGSGGGYARKFLDVSSISTSTITVGAGGAGVTAAVGNAGGLSKWADGSNNVIGNGGNGATQAAYNCVVGGTATGGDVNIQGGCGTWFNYMKSTGGGSVLGHGGCGGYNTIVDQDPTGYGGGSGGFYKSTSAAGTDGIVIVTEYK